MSKASDFIKGNKGLMISLSFSAIKFIYKKVKSYVAKIKAKNIIKSNREIPKADD